MKILGHKAYGSIPHLPNSKLGPGDHYISPGQARICTEKPRDRHDVIIVQEKIDGSCVAVYRQGNTLYPLVRAGWSAWSTPFEQHTLFAEWVQRNEDRFRQCLRDGERLVGEWIAQAHGTLYEIGENEEPFFAFDIMSGKQRLLFNEFAARVKYVFHRPKLMHNSGNSIAVDEAYRNLCAFKTAHVPEGLVYRVERKGKVDFLAKWVRHDFVPGQYLPKYSGEDARWLWWPTWRQPLEGITQ